MLAVCSRYFLATNDRLWTEAWLAWGFYCQQDCTRVHANFLQQSITSMACTIQVLPLGRIQHTSIRSGVDFMLHILASDNPHTHFCYQVLHHNTLKA